MIFRDTFSRELRDLRISVTDRCNLRCSYCMPREVFGPDYSFLEREELLSFEEIERLARIFIACGTRKLRITGGEPLVRRELPELVRRLAQVRPIPVPLVHQEPVQLRATNPQRFSALR